MMVSAPALTSISPDPGLPQPLTLLVGRVWEVASAGALLRDPQVRLLTLTGPAGVGKTRLALRLAEQARPDYPQGMLFVPLAAVRDPEMVIPAIAESLRIPASGDADLSTRLACFLGDRPVLIVLDNFEQVTEAATAVGELLRGAPRLKVLVTSRIPLRLSGEQEFSVEPLSMPQSGSPATPVSVTSSDAGALFLQRARAVRPEFEISSDTAAPVAEICRRLDGLPLAIELAASRMKMLTPPTLLARLSDRMRILTDGPRDAPQRLQTMRAAISWSYDLLNAEEQYLFRQLAVFDGGFGIEAALAMSERDSEISVFDGIASLVDKSLLTQTESVTGDARFMMLETIREFAWNELVRQGEEHAARRRQAGWLDDLVLETRPVFASRRNLLPWLGRLDEEHDNIRTVLDWQMAAGEWDAALRLCGDLAWYWDFRGHHGEGLARIEAVLQRAPTAPVEDRARANFSAAMLAHSQGEDDKATVWARRSIALAPESGDQWIAILGLAMLGILAEDSGRFDEAAESLEAALAIAQRFDYPSGVELVLNHLGVIAWGRGQTEQALEHWKAALAIQREIGDLWGAAVALSFLGIAACESGDLKSAFAMHQESLTYFWEFRNAEDIAHGLSNMAMVLVAAGSPERAARLFGAADSARAVVGSTVKEPERSIFNRYVRQSQDALGAEAFAAAWNAGRALGLEDAVAEAMLPVEATRGETTRMFDLTEREMDVLRLLAEGRSDREIGEMLFISTRTAQTHVSHILGKLGVSSRSAATALAIREGLANL
jgi:non-specific serine/threonine protein kinase